MPGNVANESGGRSAPADIGAAPDAVSNRRRGRRQGSDEPRTRGGWTPAGTSARRRETQAERRTERGQRTRQEIVAAARRVFERSGYLDVGVDEVVAEAGVARGSFYTYFPTKLAVFKVLAGMVGKSIDDAIAPRPEDSTLDPIDALDRSNRRYIQAYREHAGMYGLLEQVATIDDELYKSRVNSRRCHVERVAGRIRRWQERRLADPTVDPVTTAGALVSMTSNFCYSWLVRRDDYDEEQVAATITQIWVRALDLRRHPRRR